MIALLAVAGALVAAVPGPGDRAAAITGDGAVLVTADGGARWRVVHWCPAPVDRTDPIAAVPWEVAPAGELAGAAPCPGDRPTLSWDDEVLYLTCEGDELWEWRAGAATADPAGPAVCALPTTEVTGTVPAPTAALPARRAVSRAAPIARAARAGRGHWLPRLSIGVSRRRQLDRSGVDAPRVGRRWDTTVWIQLTWRLGEILHRPATTPVQERSTP